MYYEGYVNLGLLHAYCLTVYKGENICLELKPGRDLQSLEMERKSPRTLLELLGSTILKVLVA